MLAKVYKGRYYANKDFLDCGKGYRPSYAWRSILFGRELLVKGLVKSIGNGNLTSVWVEKWILDGVPRRPVNRQYNIDVNSKVAELLGGEDTWNMDMLTELFPLNEVARIRLLTAGDVEDWYIWAYSRNGAYTVKSGYGVIVQTNTEQEGPVSVIERHCNVLKTCIWKIPTLPKIRMFLWRALSGALAVADCLVTRGILLDTTCKLCRGNSESINHVLFQCPVAQEIWSKAGLILPLVVMQQSLEQNMELVFDLIEDVNKPQTVRRLVPWNLWLVWKNRNGILYADTQESVERLLKMSCEEAEQWFLLNKAQNQNANIGCNEANVDKWCPPSVDLLKCNVHANWRNERLHSGVAWIVRDHTGNVMYHARDAMTFSPNRLVAELRCIEWTLRSLVDLQVSSVNIASDYKEVIEAINAPLQWPRYRALLTQIINLRSCFVAVSFEEEKVGTNGIARDIAKSVLRDGRFQSYLALGGPGMAS